MKKFIYSVGFIAIICAMVITCVEMFSFNVGYYDKTYSKLKTADTIGISEEDLHRSTIHLLEYIKGDHDNLDVLVTIDGQEVPMFNQREIDHMVDVQVLMVNVLNLRNVLAIIGVIILIVAVTTKDIKDLVLIRQSLIKSLMLLGLIFGFIGLYAFIDFDSFWIQFHEVLFTNDLWLLNPAVDRLIMMVPQEFFSGLVYRIVAGIAFIILAFVSLAYALGRRIQHVAHRSL